MPAAIAREARRGGRVCEHGGRAFEAIGEGLDDLSRRRSVVAADVLDAWFAPAPAVIEALREHLEWSLSASPPTGCEGLVRAIARARGVPEECIVAGAGSSALIYLALPRWLARGSRALILEPTYGEYAHVLERVVGCRVDRLSLREEDGFAVPLEELRARLASGRYDLAVIVNPNNPTGVAIPRAELEPVLGAADPRTIVWVDEAYSEYAGEGGSVERFAAASASVVVCKSLSKVYALSGARAAYLCGPPGLIAGIRERTPPWAVSLPGQIAAVRALGCTDYYRACWERTHRLRGTLAERLRGLAPWRVLEGCLNAVLCLSPGAGSESRATREMPSCGEIVAACRERGVYLRDCSGLAPAFDGRAMRVAVRGPEETARIVRALAAVLGPG